MRTAVLLLIVILTGNHIYSQRQEFRLAKKAVKSKDYFSATTNSAKVLSNWNSTKKMIKVSHSILSKNIHRATDQKLKKIADLEKLLENYDRDKSVQQQLNVVTLFEDLIKLGEILNNLPTDRLKAPSKKSQDIVIDFKDFGSELDSADTKLQIIKKRAAIDYLEAAREYSKSSDLESLKTGFAYYTKALKLDLELNDKVKSASVVLGNRIAEQLVAEINTKSNDLNALEDDLIKVREALNYSKEEKINQLENSLVSSLSTAYFNRASVLLDKIGVNGTLDGQEADRDSNTSKGIETIKVGLDKKQIAKVLFERISGNSNATTKQTSDTQKVTNKSIKNRGNNASASNALENAQKIKIANKAISYLEKVKEFNPNYTELRDKINIAKNMTNFLDIRDQKTYATAQIGDLIWMTRNMDIELSGSQDFFYCKQTTEKIFPFPESQWYSWDLANSGNVCPRGWRIPSDDDWNKLREEIFKDYRNWYTFNPKATGSNKVLINGSVEPCDKWSTGSYSAFWSSSSTDLDVSKGFGTKVLHYFEFMIPGRGSSPKISTNNPKINDSRTSDWKRIEKVSGREDKMMNCRCVMDAYEN